LGHFVSDVLIVCSKLSDQARALVVTYNVGLSEELAQSIIELLVVE
jgi:hypothetical protein